MRSTLRNILDLYGMRQISRQNSTHDSDGKTSADTRISRKPHPRYCVDQAREECFDVIHIFFISIIEVAQNVEPLQPSNHIFKCFGLSQRPLELAIFGSVTTGINQTSPLIFELYRTLV